MIVALCPEPENYSAVGLAAIREFARLDALMLGQEELESRIHEYDILFVRLHSRVTKDLLEKGTRLRAVVSPTTGLNHIDLDTAEAMGIEVFHLRGETEFLRTVTSTAEHTWALLLSLVRKIPTSAGDVLAGNWQQDVHRGCELQGKRLGILGFGRLGQIVAGYGRTFRMEVSVYDHRPIETREGVTVRTSIEELLCQVDVLSIHVPLNESTAGMIGRDELALLPAGAFVVNTSRGELIDELALIEALDSGKLGGIAADVVAEEHAINANRLIKYATKHQNVLITPHIGGATFEAVEKTDLFLIKRLGEWLETQQ